LNRSDSSRFEQRRTLYGGGNSAAHQAVEPVVIASLWSQFPFVDSSPATFGPDSELGSEVLGQEAVRVGLVAE
jgi:hypothetical protein